MPAFLQSESATISADEAAEQMLLKQLNGCCPLAWTSSKLQEKSHPTCNDWTADRRIDTCVGGLCI